MARKVSHNEYMDCLVYVSREMASSIIGGGFTTLRNELKDAVELLKEYDDQYGQPLMSLHDYLILLKDTLDNVS